MSFIRASLSLSSRHLTSAASHNASSSLRSSLFSNKHASLFSRAPVSFLSTYPDDRKYATSHEWVKVEGGVATVGISHHAQEALGDIVFIELPDVGLEAEQGKPAVTVESVKATAEVYAPVNGKVVEVNDKLPDAPELINSDPHADGWMFKLEVADSAQVDALMSSSQYEGTLDDK